MDAPHDDETSTDPMVSSPKRHPMGGRCIFLGGAPRSGTTYLQLLLFASGAFATVQETHLFSAFLGRMDETWKRFKDRAAHHRHVGLPAVITPEAFDEMLRSMAERVLAEIALQDATKRWLLEKTPENVLHWPLILRLLPKARFIVMVRDPRAVVASTIAARAWAGDWAQREVAQITEGWVRSVRACLSLEAAVPQVVRVKFERLRSETPTVLNSVLRRFDVNLSPMHIDRVIEAVSLKSLRAGQFVGPWPLDQEPADFFRQGGIDSWRDELPPVAIAQIEHVAHEEMRILGYSPVIAMKGRVGD